MVAKLDRTSPAIEVLGHLEDGGIRVMDNGTVSVYLDRGESLLRVFCEPEPDPDDWRQALALARELGNGEPPDEVMDGGTLVLLFALGTDDTAPALARGAGAGRARARHSSRGRHRSAGQVIAGVSRRVARDFMMVRP